MYGSIFNLKPKDGKKDELINHLKNGQDIPDGGVGWYVLNPDNDGDLVGIATVSYTHLTLPTSDLV